MFVARHPVLKLNLNLMQIPAQIQNGRGQLKSFLVSLPRLFWVEMVELVKLVELVLGRPISTNSTYSTNLTNSTNSTNYSTITIFLVADWLPEESW